MGIYNSARLQGCANSIYTEQIMWVDWSALARGMCPFWTTCSGNWKEYQSNLSTLKKLLGLEPAIQLFCTSLYSSALLLIMELDQMFIIGSLKNAEYWIMPRSTEAKIVFNISYGFFLCVSSLKSTILDGFYITLSCTFLCVSPSLQILSSAKQAKGFSKRWKFSWVWESDKLGVPGSQLLCGTLDNWLHFT